MTLHVIILTGPSLCLAENASSVQAPSYLTTRGEMEGNGVQMVANHSHMDPEYVEAEQRLLLWMAGCNPPMRPPRTPWCGPSLSRWSRFRRRMWPWRSEDASCNPLRKKSTAMTNAWLDIPAYQEKPSWT